MTIKKNVSATIELSNDEIKALQEIIELGRMQMEAYRECQTADGSSSVLSVFRASEYDKFRSLYAKIMPIVDL